MALETEPRAGAVGPGDARGSGCRAPAVGRQTPESRSRRRRFSTRQHRLATGDHDGRDRLRAMTEDEFAEWMEESGYAQQIRDALSSEIAHEPGEGPQGATKRVGVVS